jgi:hypothetical protein
MARPPEICTEARTFSLQNGVLRYIRRVGTAIYPAVPSLAGYCYRAFVGLK